MSDVQVRRRIGNALVVTYEEWAHDAVDAPHNNARPSTIVLRAKATNSRSPLAGDVAARGRGGGGRLRLLSGE